MDAPASRIGVIIAAGGTGSRFGQPGGKQLALLDGVPVVAWAIEPFLRLRGVCEIVVVCDPERCAEYEYRLSDVRSAELVPRVVGGGASRQESVARGLEALSDECDLVAVHDGARPLVTLDLIERVVAQMSSAAGVVGAVVGHPSVDTLKRVEHAGESVRVAETPDRAAFWAIQTPQVFRATVLRAAYRAAEESGFAGTDDASLVERLGETVLLVEGPRDNIKVTHAEDLAVAEAIMRSRGTETGETMTRIGIGFDAHAFEAGRSLVLGGVIVPHDRGLAGHSDADVLAHALMDAILGALRAEDIGAHFPDTDPAFRGISSLDLLSRVAVLAGDRGWRLVDADTVLVAEAPTLSPFRDQMRENLARALGVDISAVGVKATTTEGLGFTGREEGIAAYAVVLMEPDGRAHETR